jgi:hypothetical protein
MSRPSEKSQKTVLKDGENTFVSICHGANRTLYPQAIGKHGK